MDEGLYSVNLSVIVLIFWYQIKTVAYKSSSFFRTVELYITLILNCYSLDSFNRYSKIHYISFPKNQDSEQFLVLNLFTFGFILHVTLNALKFVTNLMQTKQALPDIIGQILSILRLHFFCWIFEEFLRLYDKKLRNM